MKTIVKRREWKDSFDKSHPFKPLIIEFSSGDSFKNYQNSNTNKKIADSLYHYHIMCKKWVLSKLWENMALRSGEFNVFTPTTYSEITLTLSLINLK